MSTPTTITIDDVEYVRKGDAPAGPPTEYRIVVADRGFVFVGPTVQNEDGSLTVSPARCIRYWGTDESKPGLGYLAQNGPVAKTKLDPSGTVRVPRHAVVLTLDTDGDGYGYGYGDGYGDGYGFGPGNPFKIAA